MNRALINTKTLFFILLLSIPLAIHAEDQAKIIAGWVEAVRIENLEYDIKAKLDSGAKTSSIHAADVTGFEKDGERWVKFTLKLKDSHGNDHELELEKPRVRNV
ncbi:MAG: RimK/LysX family protein, partial [Pseudomonadota bacterium]